MQSVLTLMSMLVVQSSPVLDADPDAPASGVAWRARNVRASLGIVMPFASPTEGFVLRLPFLVELHNRDETQLLPWEFWRARVTLEGGWRFGPELALLLALEHESDHASNGSGAIGFVNLNALSTRAEGTWTLGECDQLDARLVLRLHVLTCTDDPDACASDGGLGGSRAFEVAVGGTWTHAGWFLSGHGSVLVGNERARAEQRLTVRSGMLLDADSGHYAFFGEMVAGNAVGFHRADEVLEVGVGIRWAP